MKCKLVETSTGLGEIRILKDQIDCGDAGTISVKVPAMRYLELAFAPVARWDSSVSIDDEVLDDFREQIITTTLKQALKHSRLINSYKGLTDALRGYYKDYFCVSINMYCPCRLWDKLLKLETDIKSCLASSVWLRDIKLIVEPLLVHDKCLIIPDVTLVVFYYITEVLSKMRSVLYATHPIIKRIGCVGNLTTYSIEEGFLCDIVKAS